MKSLIKKILYQGGAFKLFSFRKTLRYVPILMYHGIRREQDNELPKKNFEKHIDSQTFIDHLQILKKYCNPISISELFAEKKLPANPVVITFDDGYKNNYDVAFPLLLEYQVPATVFVTTGFVDRTHFLWTDRLEYMVVHSARNDTISLQGGALILRMDDEREKIKTFSLVKEKLKNYNEEDRLEALENIEYELGTSYEWVQVPSELMPLSWDEIREMKNSGLVEIGSHTVSHPILSRCSGERQLYELATSKDRISEELGGDCMLFAYPNGRHIDYTRNTIRILKECGYKIALTTISGYNDRFINSYEIKRFGTGVTLEDFACIVSGFSRLTGKLKF